MNQILTIKSKPMKISKLILAFLFIASASSFAQTADEVIDKHFKAIGGKEKIASIKSMRMIGKLKGGGQEFPFEQIVKTPALNLL